jgi:ribosome-binding factor A
MSENPANRRQRITETVEDIIRKLASNFLAREINRTSLVTVTRVVMSDHGHQATILISVLPEKAEDAALSFCKRKRTEFREYVKGNSRFRIIPTFDFAIDVGEKNWHAVNDNLLKN